MLLNGLGALELNGDGGREEIGDIGPTISCSQFVSRSVAQPSGCSSVWCFFAATRSIASSNLSNLPVKELRHSPCRPASQQSPRAIFSPICTGQGSGFVHSFTTGISASCTSNVASGGGTTSR